MKSAIRALLFISVMAVAACSKGEKQAVKTEKPLTAVETAVTKLSDIVEGVEVTGTLEPKNAVDVKTQIPGLVRQVYVNEWVYVKKGDPLIKIDLSETEALVKRAEASVASAKAALAESRVGLARSERELARVKNLKSTGLATQKSVDDAETDHEATLARVEAAKAQISAAEEEFRQGRARLSKGLVTAPVSGMVALKNVNVGSLTSDAAAAAPIFRIVDNSLLNLTVTIPSVESAKIKKGQKLSFYVDSMPDRVFEGVVMFINPEISSADRSMKVIAEIRNPSNILKGGLFAKGKIITGTRKGVLLLPRSAVLSFDQAAHTGNIFIFNSGKAELKPLKTGAETGENIEVVSGLKAGEEFISRGGFNLKSGDAVSVKGASK